MKGNIQKTLRFGANCPFKCICFYQCFNSALAFAPQHPLCGASCTDSADRSFIRAPPALLMCVVCLGSSCRTWDSSKTCIQLAPSLYMVPLSASSETAGMLWKWCGRMRFILVWSVSITILSTKNIACFILSSFFGTWVVSKHITSTGPWGRHNILTVMRTVIIKGYGCFHTHTIYICLIEANVPIKKYICRKDKK